MESRPPGLTACICAMGRLRRRELKDIRRHRPFPSWRRLYRASAAGQAQAADAVAGFTQSVNQPARVNLRISAAAAPPGQAKILARTSSKYSCYHISMPAGPFTLAGRTNLDKIIAKLHGIASTVHEGFIHLIGGIA